MNLKGRNLLNSVDFSVEELFSVISLAEEIQNNPEKFSRIASGKVMASLFFEPSTRTRLSFEAAMIRIGGSVIGFSDPGVSSQAKGETIEDTVKTVECYSDIIVMRHPQSYTPHKVSRILEIPLINAGDGANQHPTQTLTDLLTIHNCKKRFHNLKIGFCGDLKYGRTVHSLIKAMDRYDSNRFVCISPESLRLPEEIARELRSPIEETLSLEESVGDLDILYMTRVQRERFPKIEDYEKVKGCYILNREIMRHAKADAIVMHPLPRVDEIDVNVDKDPRAVYFKQAKAGMYARMALIAKLLGVEQNAAEEGAGK